jgi:hypothetical protein
LLAERGSLLATRTWPDGAALAVSDFWFDQSLAYGRQRLDAGEFIELRTRHQGLAQTVVPPKLVVLLTGRAAPGGAPPVRKSVSPASSPEADRLKHALQGLIGPGSGPVLELPADDWELLWAEVAAAVAAMS